VLLWESWDINAARTELAHWPANESADCSEQKQRPVKLNNYIILLLTWDVSTLKDAINEYLKISFTNQYINDFCNVFIFIFIEDLI
jgi:hypothetical protein